MNAHNSHKHISLKRAYLIIKKENIIHDIKMFKEMASNEKSI